MFEQSTVELVIGLVIAAAIIYVIVKKYRSRKGSGGSRGGSDDRGGSDR